MTFSQHKEELIQKVAEAMKNSGRTCDEDSWPYVMATEAVNCILKHQDFERVMGSMAQAHAAEVAALNGRVEILEKCLELIIKTHDLSCKGEECGISGIDLARSLLKK